MNYERTVLEMLERIKTLEEKVNSLEENNHDHKNLDNGKINKAPTEAGQSGRTLSRNEVMKILHDNYGFNVKKANRSEGSGIVILKDNKSFNVKVSYCRSFDEYANEEVICTGWHTLFENDLNNPKFPFFIFVIADAAKKLHYFIFKRENIINEFKYKVLDANKKLHFYFRVRKDGRPFEVREIEKDMICYYNNWTVFENIK
jgi:hypothetical protein